MNQPQINQPQINQPQVNLRRSVDPKELVNSVDVALGDCFEAAENDMAMRPEEREIEI